MMNDDTGERRFQPRELPANEPPPDEIPPAQGVTETAATFDKEGNKIGQQTDGETEMLTIVVERKGDVYVAQTLDGFIAVKTWGTDVPDTLEALAQAFHTQQKATRFDEDGGQL